MSLEYSSTRGQDTKRYQFTDALLTSTAIDGGLLVPEVLPKLSLDDLHGLCFVPYSKRAAFVLNSFQPNLHHWIVEEATRRAYGTNFDHPDITPVVYLKQKQYMLELWHGPTASFKDMALQFMPLLFSRALEQANNERVADGKPPLHYLVLTTTSGDTGSAAEAGYADISPYCSVIVFYPDGHVSRLQELQMRTQPGTNIGVHPVCADFDAAQTAVKDTFGDRPFQQALMDYNTVLSSANSINWGRIIPQITYHVSGYIELVRQGVISLGDTVDIAVPTGNVDNLLAAFYAKLMGLPIDRLICASNENNVLTEFLETGVYDITKRRLVKTPSPSMDILIASNVERLLHAITNDPQRVNQWMHELKTRGGFAVDSETTTRLREEFYAGWVGNEECLANIKHTVDETGYLMDPHTSVAQVVAQEYIDHTPKVRPIVICSTAHWAKFARDVRDALFGGHENLPTNQRLKIDPDDEFTAIQQIKILVDGASEPESIAGLAQKPARHVEVIDATVGAVENAVMVYLRERGLQKLL